MVPENSNRNKPDDFLASLMSHAPMGILSVNESGVITHANRLARALLQLSSPDSAIIGQNILDCIEHIPLIHEKFSGILEKNRKSFNVESLNINDRFLMVKGVSFNSGFICIINDVTRMKEMEVGSIQSIIAGQENERKRIAREIHDGIGPLLSAANLELDTFLDEHGGTNDKESEEKLQNIRNTLHSITSDLRDLSHHLIPRLLEEFGLYSAFVNLTTKINNSSKSRVEFYCNFDAEVRFDHGLELNLYRCGQELINNAVKHASASAILVQMIKHDHSIILMVEDDGIGFDQNIKNPDNSGIGIINIETRVMTLNGEFILESRKNKGTIASIEIPL